MLWCWLETVKAAVQTTYMKITFLNKELIRFRTNIEYFIKPRPLYSSEYMSSDEGFTESDSEHESSFIAASASPLTSSTWGRQLTGNINGQQTLKYTHGTFSQLISQILWLYSTKNMFGPLILYVSAQWDCVLLILKTCWPSQSSIKSFQLSPQTVDAGS